ncbi:hypothetical protein HMPREF0262_02237 [Clostridium sp. ATCC 29733]|nr:hypothetical protein HMPREF0262_02237 [Clostridium sp. ATCC 29733]
MGKASAGAFPLLRPRGGGTSPPPQRPWGRMKKICELGAFPLHWCRK